MARNRFRWTRERYLKAHRLDRLLCRHIHGWGPDLPPIVQAFHELWCQQETRSVPDQLADPLYLRLARHKGDDIPF